MSAETNNAEGTLVSHLLELRDRLLRGVGSVLVFFIILAPFADFLYGVLADPLMSALPGYLLFKHPCGQSRHMIYYLMHMEPAESK